jgi:hypothetical protein
MQLNIQGRPLTTTQVVIGGLWCYVAYSDKCSRGTTYHDTSSRRLTCYFAAYSAKCSRGTTYHDTSYHRGSL